MRKDRKKAARKDMEFFERAYGFKPAYRILLDGTFLNHLVQQGVQPKEVFSQVLDSGSRQDRPPVIYTSYCVVDELRGLSKLEDTNVDARSALRLTESRNVGIRRLDCGHKDTKQTVDQCIWSLFTMPDGCMKEDGEVDVEALIKAAEAYCPLPNAQGLMVATQDFTLRAKLRSIPGVPLLYMVQDRLVLERPSAVSKAFSDARNNSTAQEDAAPEEKTVPKQPHKTRKKKGANPMSMKKKVTGGPAEPVKEGDRKPRKRLGKRGAKKAMPGDDE